MKNSFILYVDTMNGILEELDDESAGRLFKAVCQYKLTQVVPELEGSLVRLAFKTLKAQIDRDSSAYEARCIRNAKNIEKRWHKDSIKELPKDTNVVPDDTSGNDVVCDTDNDSDTDNDTDIKEEVLVLEEETTVVSKPKKRFVKPTQSEVKEYFVAAGLDVNESDPFFFYYESNGWRVGKNPMVSWHRAASGWCSRAKANKSHGSETKFERQCREQQQMANALANDCAKRIQDEQRGQGEGGFVPVPLF